MAASALLTLAAVYEPACTPTDSGDCGPLPDNVPECRAGCDYLCGSQCGDICAAAACWECSAGTWRLQAVDCVMGCMTNDAGTCADGGCDIQDAGPCGPPDGSNIPACRPGCGYEPSNWCSDHCSYGCYTCESGSYQYVTFDCVTVDAGALR